MQQIIGTLLHTKKLTSKKNGREFTVISILDDYDTHTNVVDITDFDNYINGVQRGEKIKLPFKSRPGKSEAGNVYINYVTAGPAELVLK